METIKDLIRLIVLLGTIVLNALLVYVLLYDPLSHFFIDRNQPYNVPSFRIVTAITFLIIALLITTSFILLYKLAKSQKIFIYAPVFSLAVLITILSASYFTLTYPGSTSGYAKDGFYYKMEIWWNTPDHKKTYKRWKSISPYDGKSNPDEIKYKLDSLSITPDQ